MGTFDLLLRKQVCSIVDRDTFLARPGETVSFYGHACEYVSTGGIAEGGETAEAT